MILTYLLLVTQLISGFSYTSYQTKIECNSKSSIIIPKSLNELRSIVTNAIKSNTNIKVIGNRHSTTDVICTHGIPINLKNFNKVTVDKVKMTATIGTGLDLVDALNRLNAAGVTINHIPAYSGITVGGAVSLGAHGSTLNHPNTLSEYLVGITYIDGQGNLRKIKEGDPDFNAFRVSLGLLGIFVDVTLRVVPSFKMRIHNYRIEDDLLTNTPNALINLARKNDWFQFWWFPTSNGLVISEGSYIDNNVEGNAKTNYIPNISPFAATASKLLFEFIQLSNSTLLANELQDQTELSLYHFNLLKPQIFTENGHFKNPAIGTAYQLMANKCDECPWDPTFGEGLALLPDEYSIGVPLSKLPAVIADMKALFNKYPTAFPLTGLFFRFSPSARGIMSLAEGRETFHIDLISSMRLNPTVDAPYGLSITQSLTQLLIFKHGGRPHWGKNGLTYFRHEILSNRYDISKFRSAVQKYDPNGLLSNDFSNRILSPENLPVRPPSNTRHCALQDYCICSRDSDCPATYSCGSLIGFNVCYNMPLLQSLVRGEILNNVVSDVVNVLP
ncbi:FAD-binding domain-containing protein [Conidiobolus coronatus NRRL 28638]|uniref:D-arabinono-1,4-lactone oxidase n=1 Tax=Conidiobolus coronatus (strain ATCC 28846 / CBS 209.66 / NRRL 28638) TaxID=796925 RepID=A0A137PGY1_CONC2|nr:FAD-binding domain-containing protein [Conidiobolus coronatus NRRL 28638]|eukprot:KXN74259.1 FAD-binding domain-containing protein [Conidiobolus coronatus NRRL 28638]